jgi:hypothetical protein
MKRLYKEGLITTLIGLSILGFCGIMIYQGKQSPESMAGWVSVGLIFLRSKDSLIALGK